MKNSFESSLAAILDAKEKRTALKLKFARQDLNSLTLSINIPGIPKTNELIQVFFKDVIDQLKNHLKAYRIRVMYDKEIVVSDSAGDFYLIPFKDNTNISIDQLKIITENFEKSQPLGRLIDVDIFSKKDGHISSGTDKVCYFCGEHAAIFCMRNKKHSYSEMRQKIFSDIKNFLKQKNENEFIKKTTSIALRSILYEVSLTPKPGLVDFSDSGIHNDMNYYTFLSSSAVLSTYFTEFCMAGFRFSGKLERALPVVRKIGLEAEKAMFEATGGVNTQKGLIFLFGISLFVLAYLYSENHQLSENNFRNSVKKIAKDIIKNELNDKVSDDKTHGEEVFEKFNKAGIRFEVENGFPLIFKTVIPFFNKNLENNTFKNQKQITEILQIGLLKIMSENDDTNILYRSNLKVLEKLKKKARKSIVNKREYKKLNKYCKKHNISPGGSADLLALSLFIHFIRNEY